ncbi:DUF4906 domain-containing protein [Parabacteroides leei]|uniref:DUF4906 domain-containing protein n=2 Tax=Parabacteroides TaxID=375288 RepID=UPI00189C267D|nr:MULTISPECIES: DUF4906 domain-containing protein [Parabacteroides]MCL3852210.1 DUF4906 domain-containing protein [Parabacteroides leei]
MASIERKLETKGVIMVLLTLGLMNIGCEDKIDSPVVNPSEGKTVEVALNIGFADETDGYELSASTKALSREDGIFNVELTPTLTPRATTTSKPDALYKLEIRQYNKDGNYLNGNDPIDQAIGQKLTVSLSEATDCQLVFVAWGQGSGKSLGSTTLSKAQEVSIDASTIESIKDDNMNVMPYILHLKHINVTGSGASGIISSPNGEDVRILLKRLATRLTFNWEYPTNTDYSLKQILLESIPLNYNVIPKPDENENNTYPSLLDQYTTIQLSKKDIEKGSYTCWVPANVRGTSNESNSALYRIKANAPTGSSYASFIAGHKSDTKKKLNYRVYLGGPDYTDFNLYGNTDYTYTVSFKHKELPVNDRRVTIIDPIPASQNNGNLVPTANCFMVVPGSAFCFDPFKYQIKGNDNNVNTTLKGWVDGEGGIAYVRVLWQTKENGDLGDPVLGVVNSDDDHTNVVDIKMIGGGDVSAESSVNNIDQAYIYCRVAPNTAGGSGAIAAYNKSNQILWSWHIWVTDYSPDPRGGEDVQTPVNKRKLKFEYKNSSFLPMMDRNLGAAAGYIDFPPNELEKSKTNGFYYQWGRKDPFIGSYSNTKIEKIPYTEIKKDAPTKGLLSLFEGDGITFHPTGLVQRLASYRDVYKDPGNMYKGNSSTSWISSQTDEYRNAWGAGITKGLHDPCPAGWRVANGNNYTPLLTGQTSGNLYYPRLKTGTGVKDGGYVLYYDKAGINTTYFYLAGYWELTGMIEINTGMHFWGGDALVDGSSRGKYIYSSQSAMWRFTGGNTRESLLLRCIQEQE